MKLDARLKAVAEFVVQGNKSKAITHIDIGSDHGHLLEHLLRRGMVARAIAVEKNEAPLKRTQTTLKGFEVKTYLGSGFGPLEKNVADSASICGLGAKTILHILEADKHKLPKRLILQANKHPEKLRCWAYANGYHLTDETIADGFWNYVILLFEHKSGFDTAYQVEDFSLNVLFKYGPWLLKRQDELLFQTLKSEYEHFKAMNTSSEAIKVQIHDLEHALDYFG